jgi:hypothetical protein
VPIVIFPICNFLSPTLNDYGLRPATHVAPPR